MSKRKPSTSKSRQSKTPSWIRENFTESQRNRIKYEKKKGASLHYGSKTYVKGGKYKTIVTVTFNVYVNISEPKIVEFKRRFGYKRNNISIAEVTRKTKTFENKINRSFNKYNKAHEGKIALASITHISVYYTLQPKK